MAIRPVLPMSATVLFSGGVKKSGPVASPSAVITFVRPEMPPLSELLSSGRSGTVKSIEVPLPPVVSTRVWLTYTALECEAPSAVPVSVAVAVGRAIWGLTPAMFGPAGLSTTKGSGLVADPSDVVTTTSPLVAPLGTSVVSDVVVAAETTAGVPLKLTLFCDAVVLKPVP